MPQDFAIRQEGLSVTDALRSPITRTLLSYWREKKGASDGVTWGDLDLMDVYSVAPYMTVCDVVDGGRDFRARYFGTGIVQVFHFDRTGKLLSEMYDPEAAEEISERYRLAVVANQPVRKVGYLYLARETLPTAFEGVYLPLLGESGAIEHVISAYDFDYQPQEGDGI
jgi:hypothetical protein